MGGNPLLSKLFHFVQVYLKSECHIPLISPEWTTHSLNKVETQSSHFMDMTQEFTKLSEIERIKQTKVKDGTIHKYRFRR